MDHADIEPPIFSGNTDESSHNRFEYIIVGGGIAGSVLASRLRERHPQRSILLIEAGKDASKHPLVSSPLNAPLLRGSELDWNYTTVTQEHVGHRPIYEGAGKALGGGSVINYGIVVPVIQSRHCTDSGTRKKVFGLGGTPRIMTRGPSSWENLDGDTRACYLISASQSIIITYRRIPINMALSAQSPSHLLLRLGGIILYDTC